MRESDNTSVNVKPLRPLPAFEPIHLMQGAGESAPLPDGDSGASDSGATPTAVRAAGQEPLYSDKGRTDRVILLCVRRD